MTAPAGQVGRTRWESRPIAPVSALEPEFRGVALFVLADLPYHRTGRNTPAGSANAERTRKPVSGGEIRETKEVRN